MSDLQSNIHFRNQIVFWVLALLGLLGFVWLFNSILLPFVLGIAIAYLLNPVVKKLEHIGFNRQAGTILILSGFFLFIIIAIAVLGPILYREISQLANDLPQMLEKLEGIVAPYQTRLQLLLGKENGDAFAFLKDNANASVGAGKTLLDGLKAGGAFISSFITMIVVVPFVAFFMMQEWPRFTKWIQSMIPRPHKDTVLDLLGQMDKKLAGFVRGQLTIALFLGILYAVALTVFDLNYGFLIGIFAGIFNIIPLVGSTLGLLAGILLAWLQTGDILFVALIGGLFIAGQVIEGNFLTPKVLGDSVGLHPLWIFFALMAGGALFGVVGMLISIPVASVFSVICAFMIRQYKSSPYYLGLEVNKPKKSALKKKPSAKGSRPENAKS